MLCRCVYSRRWHIEYSLGFLYSSKCGMEHRPRTGSKWPQSNVRSKPSAWINFRSKALRLDSRRMKSTCRSEPKQRELMVVQLNFFAAGSGLCRTEASLDSRLNHLFDFLAQSSMTDQAEEYLVVVVHRDDLLRNPPGAGADSQKTFMCFVERQAVKHSKILSSCRT
jgi:hypothetical protein